MRLRACNAPAIFTSTCLASIHPARNHRHSSGDGRDVKENLAQSPRILDALEAQKANLEYLIEINTVSTSEVGVVEIFGESEQKSRREGQKSNPLCRAVRKGRFNAVVYFSWSNFFTSSLATETYLYSMYSSKREP